MFNAVPTRILVTVLLAASLMACGGSSKPAAPPTPPASPTIAAAVLDAVCHADHVDSTSTIYIAATPDGQAHRLVVTPSRQIADMGNLIFSMDGTFLGHATGGEGPQDMEFMAQESARVAGLMDGAVVANDQTPQPCP